MAHISSRTLSQPPVCSVSWHCLLASKLLPQPLLFTDYHILVNYQSCLILNHMAEEFLSSDFYEDENDDYQLGQDFELIGRHAGKQNFNQPKKRRRIRPDVYGYYENLTPNDEWPEDKGIFKYTYVGITG
ncbi:hypothetical protein O181_065127 [Austropuccinia psidii MF-1]|uniref:Uncharacterized protein n=1 Tax=Austropuccinia psidii MF-1 TaxID=1389203 RepID=A0A9Q3ESX5_9BASI|nr:hypothetical protein [Austropuccinia psidii MF-1]